jgi:hypothetical protein
MEIASKFDRAKDCDDNQYRLTPIAEREDVAVKNIPVVEVIGTFAHVERAVEASKDTGDGEWQAKVRGNPVKKTSGEDEKASSPFVPCNSKRLRRGRPSRSKDPERPPACPEKTQSFEQAECNDCDGELFQNPPFFLSSWAIQQPIPSLFDTYFYPRFFVLLPVKASRRLAFLVPRRSSSLDDRNARSCPTEALPTDPLSQVPNGKGQDRFEEPGRFLSSLASTTA